MNIKKINLLIILFSILSFRNIKAETSFTKKKYYQPAKAANQLMNIFYQNCKASSLSPYDFLKDGELQGFEANFNPDTNGKVSSIKSIADAKKLKYLNCKENNSIICQTPPSYLWGGKGVYNSDKNQFDIFHNNAIVELKANHPGLDCSGFVNLTFILAGLKVDHNFPFQNSPDEISAKEFMKPLSCFKEVRIEKNEKIQNGDVIAWNKHIVIIDKVSKDPFGIKKITNPEDCDLRKLNPENAQMVIINSKGANDPLSSLELDITKHNSHLSKTLKLAAIKTSGVGPGIIKNKLGQLTFTNPEDVMDLIQTACLAKFKIQLPSRKIKIVRHKLADQKYSQEDLLNCTIPENERPEFIGNHLNCN